MEETRTCAKLSNHSWSTGKEMHSIAGNPIANVGYSVVKKIWHAAKNDDLSIFGVDPCNRLGKLYGIELEGGQVDAAQYVEKQFKRLLKDTAVSMRCKLQAEWNGKEAHADVEYFTHIVESNDYLPWVDEHPRPNHLEELELEPISREWNDLVNPDIQAL